MLSLVEDDTGIVGITLQHPGSGTPPGASMQMGYSARGDFHTGPANGYAPVSGTPHLRVVNSDRDIPPDHETGDTNSDSAGYDETGNEAPAVNKTENNVPAKTEYSPTMISALSRDAEMKQTLSSVENSLGAPISPAHMQLIMYLTCDLGFPGDMVSYLYRLGADRGKTGPRYLETIALNWSSKNIKTVRDATTEAADFNGKYRPVKQALGFHRDLVPAEKEIIDGWDEFGFSTEIIEEACRRTVIQTGDTNLKYITKILEGWHNNGVKTLEDVKNVDEAFQKNKTKRARSPRRGHPNSNAFQNFKQRDYTDEDYEDMERQFLQRKNSN
ncbi:MAG: DnaD domain protein [Eubacterium sp.]|nr:DnaD domain protein [Eubacterium sp.]